MTTTLHAGTTFLISDDTGQVGTGSQGLYFQDARFLSTLELFIDGKAPIPLSTLRTSARESTHVSTNPDVSNVQRDTLAVIRHRPP